MPRYETAKTGARTTQPSERRRCAEEFSHVESLGRILYEEMEFLAPSSPERLIEWAELTQWQRSLYTNCVERLLNEGELIDRARKLADHDAITRAPHK